MQISKKETLQLCLQESCFTQNIICRINTYFAAYTFHKHDPTCFIKFNLHGNTGNV